MTTERPILKLGDLSGPDGNAFMVLGKAKQAAKKAGWTNQEITVFFQEATSGDYDHLLEVVRNNFLVTD